MNGSDKLLCYIIQGWKGLQETNTLAYWAHSKVTKKMKCCEYGPIGRTATDKTKVKGLNPGTGWKKKYRNSR
jgi:hypothetical protein